MLKSLVLYEYIKINTRKHVSRRCFPAVFCTREQTAHPEILALQSLAQVLTSAVIHQGPPSSSPADGKWNYPHHSEKIWHQLAKRWAWIWRARSAGYESSRYILTLIARQRPDTSLMQTQEITIMETECYAGCFGCPHCLYSSSAPRRCWWM